MLCLQLGAMKEEGFPDSRRLEETIEGRWTIWILLFPGVPAVRSQLGRVPALQGPHPGKE